MDVNSLQNNANTASSQATDMAASLPSVLQELKGSLNQIFNKDNPLVKERTGYLENYLSAGDKARASYLPQNSGFAYSPTELNALVSSRQASSLAPLASVNQLLMGQYGNLKDYLGQAGDVFGARVTAAQQNAQLKRQMYQDELTRQQQEFANNLDLAKFEQSKKNTGTGLGSLAGMFGNQNNSTKPAFNPYGGVGSQPYGPLEQEQPAPTRSPYDATLQDSGWMNNVGRFLSGLNPFRSQDYSIPGSQPLNLNGLNLNIK